MEFLIIGAGSVGTNLAERVSVNNNVTIVDSNSAQLDKISSELDLKKIHGSGTDPVVLKQAGILSADYVVAVTNKDTVNISIGLIAKLSNPNAKRVARVQDVNLEHDSVDQTQLNEMFNLIINPPKVTADYIQKLLLVPNAQDVISFADNKLIEFAIKVQADSEITGKKISALMEIKDRFPSMLNAIVRDETVIIPRGSDRILADDLIYVVTFPEHIREVQRITGQKNIELKNVMIFGKNIISRKLCKLLDGDKFKCKLILDRAANFESWQEELKNTLIIKGDISDSALLLQENISEVDAFIAIDDNEEQNIISALLAKKLGAKFVAVRVDNVKYVSMLRSIGIDAVINSQYVAALNIVEFIYSNSIISASSLVHSSANTIEVAVEEDSHLTSGMIKDLRLPYGILISAIMRGDDVIIPRGDDQIIAGDRVIVFFLKSVVKKVEELLKLELKLLN